MNPFQEGIARNFAVKAKRALKDVQGGIRTSLISGSSNSSSGPAVGALSSAHVSLKTKRPRVEGSIDLTREKGTGKYGLPPVRWTRLSSRVPLYNFNGLSLLTLKG